MQPNEPHAASFKQRMEEEAKNFAIIALYLFVVFSAFTFYRSAILQSEGVHWVPWGFAALKALVSAKFILLARMFKLDRGFESKPLIWQTVSRSLVFLVFVSALNVIEEMISGRLRGEAVHDTLSHVGGGTPEQMVATSIILFLVFVPFFAFGALSDTIRDKGLWRTFFVERLDLAPTDAPAPRRP